LGARSAVGTGHVELGLPLINRAIGLIMVL
jgi:hypothetical protein